MASLTVKLLSGEAFDLEDLDLERVSTELHIIEMISA